MKNTIKTAVLFSVLCAPLSALAQTDTTTTDTTTTGTTTTPMVADNDGFDWGWLGLLGLAGLAGLRRRDDRPYTNTTGTTPR
jgi:MYXO-CTERM domain-containing protein